MTATLGYWNLRGRAQHIRLMLEYANTPYTEKRYEVELNKGAENYKYNWMKEKFTLGMELPNLPYYFDGSHKITQSNAICRYIARKNNLMGKTEEEEIKCDMLENLIQDYRRSRYTLVYSSMEEFEKKKPQYINETMKEIFETLSKVLGTNQWFSGGDITYIDFHMYELIDIHRELQSCCLKNFPNLQNFMDRFEALPAIKKYRNSSNFIKKPINGPAAAFGGK